MAQTTTILVRIDEDVKRDAEVMLDKLGMNFSTAINMFFRQLIMDEAFPLRPKIKRRRLTTAERLKGYEGVYKAEEWNTGEPVGQEVF